jgi:hypothetical protein
MFVHLPWMAGLLQSEKCGKCAAEACLQGEGIPSTQSQPAGAPSALPAVPMLVETQCPVKVREWAWGLPAAASEAIGEGLALPSDLWHHQSRVISWGRQGGTHTHRMLTT